MHSMKDMVAFIFLLFRPSMIWAEWYSLLAVICKSNRNLTAAKKKGALKNAVWRIWMCRGVRHGEEPEFRSQFLKNARITQFRLILKIT